MGHAYGDGDDILFDYGGPRDWEQTDTLVFGVGITPADLIFSKVEDGRDSVRIGFVGQAGSILLEMQNWYDDVGIEAIHFADGTTWNHAQLTARYVADQQSAGDDVIRGSNLSDVISAGAGNDRLFGYSRDDTLIGGTGEDRLEGGHGNDTYVYNRGDGDDVLYDYGGPRDWEQTDTLVFGVCITPADLIFSKVEDGRDSVRIGFVGQAGSILLEMQNWYDDVGIEAINFADGTTWNHAQLTARYVADQQTAGDDVVKGSNLSDVISAGGGNDRLFGYSRDDNLIGGTGNDRLEGGHGNDTYVYNRGDGDDVLYDYGGPRDWEQTDTLVFGVGIAPADLIFSKVEDGRDSVRIGFVGEAGSILLEMQNWYDDVGIEAIHFADGTTWNHAQLTARYVSDQQSAGYDVIRGSNLNDVISAGAGNDGLFGYSRDDTLIGGLGDDRLEGGHGNDTYVYNLGDGDDVLYDYGGPRDWEQTDTLVFGVGITPADLIFSTIDDGRASVRIGFVGQAGSILLDRQNANDVGIEAVNFADGTAWDHAELVRRSTAPPVAANAFREDLDGFSGDIHEANGTGLLYMAVRFDVLGGQPIMTLDSIV